MADKLEQVNEAIEGWPSINMTEWNLWFLHNQDIVWEALTSYKAQLENGDSHIAVGDYVCINDSREWSQETHDVIQEAFARYKGVDDENPNP